LKVFVCPTELLQEHKSERILSFSKNDQKISNNISNYFENHPERILGEIKEKTNRFGRLENYIHGNLEDVLIRMENLKNRKETERIGNLFEDLLLEVEDVKKVEKTIKTEKLKNNSEEDLTTENEIDFSELNEKIEQVLTALNNKIQISQLKKKLQNTPNCNPNFQLILKILLRNGLMS
jgi:hypothetical protein